MHRRRRHAQFAVLAVAFASCGGETPAAPSTTSAPSAAPEAPAAAPAAVEPAPAAAPSPLGPVPEVPAGASVSFLTPSDGGVIKGAVVDGKVMVPVRMKVDGMKLEPAGPVKAGSGHHHIIVDTTPPALGQVVPADEQHLHFGKAQSEALVPLAPGPHELTLQFADGLHRSYGPALSAKISVRVIAAPGAAAPGATAPTAPAGDDHAGH